MERDPVLLEHVVGAEQRAKRSFERRMLTTNLAFNEWPTIFPKRGVATVPIDRVVHHAEIVDVEGERLPPPGSRSP